MKDRIVNHSWHSMLNEDPSAKVFVETKIEEVRNITREIEGKEGEQSAKNVLDDGLILHALKRMHEYLEGSSTIRKKIFTFIIGMLPSRPSTPNE